MPANKKTTSAAVAHIAAEILDNKNSSAIAKTLAASALSQRAMSKQTGAKMEKIASSALQDGRLAKETKTVAASVLSQANKARKAK
ncbi:hypothetical protein SAMN05421770_104327 [Granulicella rosea]|uniref:Uncharacterized protein n=1 Tax=Granulicella rosea TaxID=474952 RepID=A0A239K781_9BACT|nr:hypothetical protein [Granulicella rosea]SNT13608.1 hypothetical protein SAMN05421770_104327 [Granulicella rosea]